MRVGFKAKKIIKSIALTLAGVAAITAVAFGVKAIVGYTKNDLKTINPSFEVGSLGSDGKYVADEGSLYTKEAFGCYGLQVKPDFDSGVDYQVFYYDILDNFVSSSEVLSEGYSAEAPVNGAYARMVIKPRDDEDGKIGFIEKIKYSNQITVKVKKEQNIDERFTSYRGRLLTVVSDVQDMVFEKGIFLSCETLQWGYANYCCATSTTVLRVDGFSTLAFNFSSLDDGYKDPICRVFQYKDLPLDDNLIFDKSSSYQATEKFSLDKNAKYIVISIEAKDSSVNLSESVLSRLTSCFSLSK